MTWDRILRYPSKQVLGRALPYAFTDPPGLRVQRSALKSLHENRTLSGNSAESTFNNQAPPMRISVAIFIDPTELSTNEILGRRLIICMKIRPDLYI